MRINEPRAERELYSAEPDNYVYVVVGSGSRRGTIKSIPIRKESSSPILVIKKTSKGMDVRVHPEYEDAGWRLLDECYQDEDSGDFKVGAATLTAQDCRKRFYTFQSKLRGAGRAVIPKDMMDNIVPGFPDEMLPSYCRELRDQRDPLSGVYDPVLDKVVNRMPEPGPEPESKQKHVRRSA